MDRRPSYPTTVTTADTHVLDPDYAPQTVHRPDLFFVNSMNTRNNTHRQFTPPTTAPPTAPPSVLPGQLYPYHQQAFHNYTPAPSQIFPHIPHPYAQTVPNVLPYDHRGRSATVPAHPPPPQTTPWHPPSQPVPKPIEYPAIGLSERRNGHLNRPALTIQTPTPAIHPPHPQPPPPADIAAFSPADDANELALALALSQSESMERQQLEESLARKEEEDLAKALAASLLSSTDPGGSSYELGLLESDSSVDVSAREGISSSRTPSRTPTPVTLQVEAPRQAAKDVVPPVAEIGSRSVNSSFLEFGRYDKWRIPSMPERSPNGSVASSNTTALLPSESIDGDHTPLSRRLSVSSSSSLPYTMPSPISSSFPIPDKAVDSSTVTKTAHSNVVTPTAPQSHQVESPADETILAFDDEAYARQLAAEEEKLARQEIYSADEEKRLQDTLVQPSSLGDSTVYTPNVTVNHAFIGQTVAYPEVQRPVNNPQASKPAMVSQSFNAYSSVVYPSLSKRRDSGSDARSIASHQSSTPSTSTVPTTVSPSYSRSEVESEKKHFAPSISEDVKGKGKEHHPVTTGMINANYFIDPELLLGVSIGFVPPAISQRLVPMQGPMPNIISMPYSQCPPLHLQAPDWRHLLRLMAGLSGTRLEPTVEAVTVSKTELKLRTVIQFVKPNPSSSAWRTILWFSTDVPVPPNTPGASRYTSGNPNLLPWSYTLITVPRLLGDAMDTNVSKTYTIPPLEGVPLPTLPITFPNLALYLQAVLDVSRKHTSDTSGIGKLGKIVQTCYPNTEVSHSEFDIPEKTTVGHLFKRVIGRSGKDKKKGKTTNNEETYQYVTPFVPDEWC
ncbi:hypothetical protein D9613_005154 [Agrocybe pediades]|uniref:Uncharacterized protein n=1 Tax=Agrocybe pediades TaxID=84607 RepID=A0A8H4VRV6_9AGAR|nr:hypothetical protein D9613_005154 [Agrocybe pediades]